MFWWKVYSSHILAIEASLVASRGRTSGTLDERRGDILGRRILPSGGREVTRHRRRIRLNRVSTYVELRLVLLLDYSSSSIQLGIQIRVPSWQIIRIASRSMAHCRSGWLCVVVVVRKPGRIAIRGWFEIGKFSRIKSG
jgi:hypothetical protein